MSHRSRFASGLTLALVAFAAPSHGQQASPDRSITVTVDAKHPWVDAGMMVQKGDRLNFDANGTIRWGDDPDQIAGPEGHDAKPGKLGKAGLIGRVGLNGKPFAIGRATAPIAMPKNGELFLGINDFIFGDNSGAFTVVITRAAAPNP
jgi:hypothetical protein